MNHDEAQCLRRIAAILGQETTPAERRTIALNIEQRISGRDSAPLAFALRHVAALFHPGDVAKTQVMRQRINAAFAAGELVTAIPKGHHHVMLSDLAAWPDRPAMAADSPLRYWVPDVPNQPQEETPPQSVPAATDGQAWTLRQPQRFRGYNAPLYRLLKAAHAAGQPCPKARDVLEAWHDAPPVEVFKVLPDELHYYDAKGNAATAPIAAVQKAIKRLTEREKFR